MKRSLSDRWQDTAGFSLVEILVSMALILLIMLTLVSMVNFSARTWTYTNGKIEQFRDARDAFESVTRRLSQATLNTYWDYQRDASGNAVAYIRQSELRFISGPDLAGSASTTPPRPSHSIFFQAPLGMTSGTSYANLETMLNTVGYYIEFGSDQNLRPPCVNSAQTGHYNYRFRLMEMVEPAESLTLYQYTSGSSGYTYKGTDWFATPLTTGTSCVVADNVIALVLLPKRAVQEDPSGTTLCPRYTYNSTSVGQAASLSGTAAGAVNSKNQLPPVVQVTMVAVDEATFNRYQTGTAMPALVPDSLFQQAGDLQDSTKNGYARDLKTLTDALRAAKLNYRVFTTDVAIRGAKWSSAETN